MKIFRFAPFFIVLFSNVFNSTYAYEEEDAVPITVAVYADDGSIQKVALKVNGRHVEIKTTLVNETSIKKRLGFFAYTPFFEQLGVAEEHADKTFSDIKIISDGKAITPIAYRRGFFLGKDITNELSRAGISPLPDLDVSEKKLALVTNQQGFRLKAWQGYVSYSWANNLLPKSNMVSVVEYQALPQFGRDDITSDRFNRHVLQHCGNPDDMRKYLRQLNGSSDELMFEQFEIPLKFFKDRQISIDISQPKQNWLGAYPMISLLVEYLKKLETI